MSRAYYNEINKFAADWLRRLIAAGHIAPGDVDERSILDVHPDDLKPYTQCHFFAGVGVWSHALRRAGVPDDCPVWTGSCPCQPFSSAGSRAGFADERHLWPAFHYLIEKRRPAIVLGEQVASHDVGPWIDLVQDDMEGLGYPLAAIAFPAASVGAPNIRDRTFWVGYANYEGLERLGGGHSTALGWDPAVRSAPAPGESGRVAHADGIAGQEGHALDRGCDAGSVEARLGLGGVCVAVRLAHTERLDAECQAQPADHEPPQIDGSADRLGRCGGASGVMAHADNYGSQPAPRDLLPDDQSDAEPCGLLAAREPDAGPVNGFWRDADWLHCRDGKWRPVEPGTQPLAYGLAASMAKLLPEQRRLAELAGLDAKSLARAKSCRVGTLRGYGNAINAEAAVAFIRAIPEFVTP